MEQEIKLINDIIFNAILHGADAGGSYDQNYDGLIKSIDAWLVANHIEGYIIQEVERKCDWGYIWGVLQIVKE